MKRKGKLLNRVCFILAIVNMFLISLLMFRIVSFFIANGISMLDKAINSRNYSINKNEAIEIYSNTDEKQVQSMNNENEKNHINQNPEIDMKNASKEEIQQWKLNYILTHSELYTSDLQELVQKNSETIDYVYGYPNYVANLNQERSFITNENDIDLTKEVREDTIPLLLQWDTRWGYISYGTGMIGYTGCAPTCLSMVALYLTKNPIYTPIYIAERAENQGYYCDGVGTSWKFMDTGCKQFGIKAKELPLHENSMKKAL
ncbi:MAG: hypothetical protein IKJ01_02450, partial [Lachnospiraceae bacterium]|nr:hypothetical protein [Lachnospiraceae bacterium]